MSTKVKKKTGKIKKVKRAPLKLEYSDEEKIELKNRYDDILFHLSNFLSEHSVYEAVPENVKILVFSSELSFYEMIKVFIFEDIYCGLIYNPNLNNYLGLITTRDLINLYKYIIDNFSPDKNENFDEYLKYIFSNNKKEIKKKEDIDDDNIENLNINNIKYINNNNINIFDHLKNITYLDYLIHVKNKEFQNINIYSVSLDDNLYETLKKININNIHRLLVEDDIKKELRDIQQLKEEEKENDQLAIKRKEILEKKRVVSNAEKTTTANDSDEENKNIPKIDMKKIMETNKEDIIVEKSENTLTRDEIEMSRDTLKKEEENNKINEINKDKLLQDNNQKPENLNINENEQKIDVVKPKKKKIVKKKKIKKQNTEENELKLNENQSIISEQKAIETEPSTNIISNNNINTETQIEKEKTVIKKKIKKKIVKKQKDINLELPEITDKNNNNGNENERYTHKKMNTNIMELNNEEKLNPDNDVGNRATTEIKEPKTEEKKKKPKKKITKRKSKQIPEEKQGVIKKINFDNIDKTEKIEANQDKTQNDNILLNKIEENEDEENYNINNNNDKQDKDKEKEKEKIESEQPLDNIHFENTMKNYVGIVTNETIFEYLMFNYYSNDMKEFNLSLNELIILGENTFLKPLTNIQSATDKVYNTFNYHFGGNYDIIPILSEKEIEGFIYPKDFLFYIYNCESDQNLSNKEFLEKLYEDVDDEKPYGKNRVMYLELNDTLKGYYVKELIEKLNVSIEKKIVLFDPNDINKLFLISLKTIFKAIVEYNLNK